MSDFESHQSPKGNTSGPFLRASHPFGDEAASDPTDPTPALHVKPRLDWNAKPPAQKTVVYFSLRHQSFSVNKLCLAFLGVFFILSHSSSIYPAFVCFSSAAFPSNSLFLAAAATVLLSLCLLPSPESKLTSGLCCTRLCSWSFISL